MFILHSPGQIITKQEYTISQGFLFAFLNNEIHVPEKSISDKWAQNSACSRKPIVCKAPKQPQGGANKDLSDVAGGTLAA